MQSEKLTYYDTVANAYIYKPGAYIYTFYYGTQPNVVKEVTDFESNVMIYPNPANNLVQLQCVDIDNKNIFTIYDIIGKKILQFDGSSNVQNNVANLNIQNLQAGIYMLQINMGSKTRTIRFIKK